MPGIYGIIRKNSADLNVNEAMLARMTARLEHSDNYATERQVDEWVAIGWTGLPEAGEPHLAHDASSGCTAAFSGYVYGFHDQGALSRGDKASRLAQLFASSGRKLPELIDGSFNLVAHDPKTRRTLIANDRMGNRQLYYMDTPDLFLFATEIKAIQACRERSGRASRVGVCEYFTYGYPLGENTLFDGVRFLRGSAAVEIDHGRVEFTKYWDFDYTGESQAPLPELIDEADALYRDIIRKRAAGYERLLTPLSGGLDSRFIVGHASALDLELHAFTHGRDGCQDHRIARQAASTLKLKNYRFIEIDSNWLVDHFEPFVDLTEGMVEASPAILLGISDQYGLAPESTCFLNGIFGGPTNFGSGYFGRAEMSKDFSHDEKMRRVAGSYGSVEMRQAYFSLFADDFVNELVATGRESIEQEFSKHTHVSDWFHNQKDVFLIRNRLTRYMNLIDCNRYRWHDHFALADDRLLDFYIKLPSELKLGRRFMIEYIKTKFPDLARVPYSATGVDLYSEPPIDRFGLQARMLRIKYYLERLSYGKLRFYNPKQYTHQSQWYRSNRRIREFYEQTLMDQRTRERGYFEPEAIEALLQRQRRGGNSFYELTWLLTFEIFMRRFIDAD